MRIGIKGFLMGVWGVVLTPALGSNIGTAFTYQGDLKKNGIAVTDPACEFRVALFEPETACVGGTNEGLTCIVDSDCVDGICHPCGGTTVVAGPQGVNAGVTDGLFIMSLDFGADAIDGSGRCLQIEVKCTNDADFVMLSPRIRLMPVPHALALPGLYTQQNNESPNLIGGYNLNAMNGDYCPGGSSGPVVGGTIGGGGSAGHPNIVYGAYGTIGGGRDNKAGNPQEEQCQNFTTVAGGERNKAIGESSTVGGGSQNRATCVQATVCGGVNNVAGNRPQPPDMDIYTPDMYAATVCGGDSNTAMASYATIGGGGIVKVTSCEFGGYCGQCDGGSSMDYCATDIDCDGNGVCVENGGGNCNGDCDDVYKGNEVSNQYGTIAGGGANAATGRFSTIGGGILNSVAMDGATVGGGYRNDAQSKYATVAGGSRNHSGGTYANVGGGENNRADGSHSLVAGGSSNEASGTNSTIGGGSLNQATMSHATVGGGDNCRAWIDYSTIGGGSFNLVNGEYGTVGGGFNNEANGLGAVVGGGSTNKAKAKYATIAGGGEIDNPAENNVVYDEYGTIGGGGRNRAGSNDGNSGTATWATVAGGAYNTAGNGFSTVGGGNSNEATGLYSTVPGGDDNTASGSYCTIGGGYMNSASDSASTVAGGSVNMATGDTSSVGGGYTNIASGDFSTVAGGVNNTASGYISTVAGGDLNIADDDHSTVGGGLGNHATNQYSTVGGGDYNMATGLASTVAGGGVNIASGNHATVPGGYSNSASGDHSFAAGRRANAGTRGSFVWADDSVDADFSAANQNVFVIRAENGVGIGTSFPIAQLDVRDSLAPASFDRLTTDGSVIQIRQNGVVEGTISVSGTTVSYGAFTGSHYGWTEEVIERGMLVAMTGDNKRRTDEPGSEPIYGILPSKVPNSSACLGSYLGLLEPNEPISLDNPHLIMAVGNGDMWIVDTGRDIKPGDYLISSDVIGHAMLDDNDRFRVGHIIARAGEAVEWAWITNSTDGRRHARISVFFENFVRGTERVRMLAEEIDSLSLRLAEEDLEVLSQQDQIQDLEARLVAMEKLVAALGTSQKGSAR